MAKYWSGAHTKHRLQCHIVWVPKYRKRVLRGEIANRLEELLREACRVNRWVISELGIQKDHVHIVMQIHPRDSVGKVAHILKGGSSRVLRKEYPGMEEFLWGDSLWADGYFAETVGKVDEVVVKRYVRQQHRSP